MTTAAAAARGGEGDAEAIGNANAGRKRVALHGHAGRAGSPPRKRSRSSVPSVPAPPRGGKRCPGCGAGMIACVVNVEGDAVLVCPTEGCVDYALQIHPDDLIVYSEATQQKARDEEEAARAREAEALCAVAEEAKADDFWGADFSAEDMFGGTVSGSASFGGEAAFAAGSDPGCVEGSSSSSSSSSSSRSRSSSSSGSSRSSESSGDCRGTVCVGSGDSTPPASAGDRWPPCCLSPAPGVTSSSSTSWLSPLLKSGPLDFDFGDLGARSLPPLLKPSADAEAPAPPHTLPPAE